ncbi:MAG TPA: helix-turn-helix transcriptional regulator [Pedomonas sp.]|uniref:AraC family transcriptional regulator n=1 Tax=Pedomonas sp. TaxID=2976421 RepID=UPI002F3FB9FA
MLDWNTLEAPADALPPDPLTLRAQTLPARSYFPEHRHAWGQLVYAISGVLAVGIPGRSYVISPEQAVWLPVGMAHRVGSLLGAEFRSLWIASGSTFALPEEPTVYGVGPLLKALIAEVAQLQHEADDDGYAGRVTRLILDQLCRARPVFAALPWPQGASLARLCEALYASPADPRSADAWGRELGMSSRTLTRRFEAEVGMSLRSWRRRMRLFKAIELLGGGMDVTQVALELGYGSPSAFIYAFRTSMGASPQAFMRGEAPRQWARPPRGSEV